MMRDLASDTRGVASIEFALAATLIITAALNAADLGSYVYSSMQVENAAQMAVQTALRACTAAQLPVIVACPGFADSLAAAMAANSLGAAVVIDGGQPVEAYFCVDAKNQLVEVGAIGSRPATCIAAGNAAGVPGDFIAITVSYTYAPLVPGASVAQLLPTTIRRSAIMRVG